MRPKGTSSSRAHEQFTTAAPARATSAASAGEMTLVATGVKHTPPCDATEKRNADVSACVRAAASTRTHAMRDARCRACEAHPTCAQAQLARQAEAAQLAAGVAAHVRLVQLFCDTHAHASAHARRSAHTRSVGGEAKRASHMPSGTETR